MQTVHRLLSFVFAGVLLISIVGIPVDDHYCGGSFITTTIGLQSEDPCGDMPMEGDCCEDDIVLFSITDYFSNLNINFFNNMAPAVLVCNYTECIKLIPEPIESRVFPEYYPPPIESKIFIEIQSFLL